MHRALWSSSTSRPNSALVRRTSPTGLRGRRVIWRGSGRKRPVVSCWFHGGKIQVVHDRRTTRVQLDGTGYHLALLEARGRATSGSQVVWRATMCLAGLRWTVSGANANFTWGPGDVCGAAGTTRGHVTGPWWTVEDLDVRRPLAFTCAGCASFCWPPVLWTRAGRRWGWQRAPPTLSVGGACLTAVWRAPVRWTGSLLRANTAAAAAAATLSWNRDHLVQTV